MMIFIPVFLNCLWLLLLLSFGQHVLAYDINCIYPQNLPSDPIDALWTATGVLTTTLPQRTETPVIVYLAGQGGLCSINCLAYHDDKVLHAITKARPNVNVPTFGYNSFSRLMCTLQCLYTSVERTGGDIGVKAAQLVKNDCYEPWGVEVRTEQDITDTGLQQALDANDWDSINRMAARVDYNPYFMGQLVALEIEQTSKNNADGWNRDGSYTYDHEVGQAVPCTASCGPFSDTIGYTPRNPVGNRDGRQGNVNKYNVTGTQRYWRPIQEYHELGVYSRQEHVTPHIGFTVTPKLRPFRNAPQPPYVDYYTETMSVVEQVRQTANDANRQKRVKFYDNKLFVRGILQVTYHFSFRRSFEDEILYYYGLDTVEHDALVNAWREKVKYDLVRPTTVIQSWGDDILDTYNGNPTSSSSFSIKARDFQSYIRVMPHSEYPSASAALCRAYADYTNAYTDAMGLDAMRNMLAYVVDVGPELFQAAKQGFGLGALKHFDTFFLIRNLATLTRECGESRLWGGMHFNASVAAGYDIVDGLGRLAAKHVVKIQNGSNFTNTWIPPRGPLPSREQCSS